MHECICYLKLKTQQLKAISFKLWVNEEEEKGGFIISRSKFPMKLNLKAPYLYKALSLVFDLLFYMLFPWELFPLHLKIVQALGANII